MPSGVGLAGLERFPLLWKVFSKPLLFDDDRPFFLPPFAASAYFGGLNALNICHASSLLRLRGAVPRWSQR